MPFPVGYPATVAEARQKVRDFGTCLNFDGSNDVVTIGTDNQFSGNFYFSAWLKWSGANGNFQHIFAKRDSYGGTTMMFDLALSSSTGNLLLDCHASNVDFGYNLPKDRWVHLVWVHNVTDSVEQIYINGDRLSNSSIRTFATGTTALNSIGAIHATPTEGFYGKMDKVCIGTGAPTWQEVLAMYTKDAWTNAWATFELDEGSGTTATDSSGNENNGTISGAAYVTDKVMTTRTAADRRFSAINQAKSLFLDGVNSRATIPFIPAQTGFNLAFWVKLVDSGVNQTIISNRTGTPQNGIRMDILLNSFRRFWVYADDNASVTINSAALTSERRVDGVWVFITMTYIPNDFRFYFNANQTFNDTACSIGDAHGVNLSFGSAVGVAINGGAAMYIKSVTFQNTTTPWTQDQITELYYNNTIPSGSIQWTLDNTAVDQNNSNAITLTSTSYSTDLPAHMKIRSAV